MNFNRIFKKIVPFVSAMACAVTLLGLSACGGAEAEGPTDEVIRAQIGDAFKRTAEASGEKIDFQVTKILRGEVLESKGARDIPAGTLVFPVKSMITITKGAVTSEPQPLEFFFFKDSYGIWQSFSKQAEDSWSRRVVRWWRNVTLPTPLVLAALDPATIGYDAQLVSREYMHLVAETKRNTIRQRPILDRCGLPLCTQS